MEKVDFTDSEEVTKVTLQKAGADFFVAVIDNEFYYNDDFEKKRFEDGKIYFPSVIHMRLFGREDISSESLTYNSDPDEPRFLLTTNLSYMKYQDTHELDVEEDHVESTTEYYSYRDLPHWMSIDAVLIEIQQLRKRRRYDLDAHLKESDLMEEKDTLVDLIGCVVVITSLVLAVLPDIMEIGKVYAVCYLLIFALVLTRMIGRISVRLLKYAQLRHEYHSYTSSNHSDRERKAKPPKTEQKSPREYQKKKGE